MGGPAMPQEVLELGFVDARWLRNRGEYISVFHARAQEAAKRSSWS